MPNDIQAVVDAVQDLTRVVIATQGNVGSKADVVRRLADLSIPPARITMILAMPQNHVTSVLAKARKKSKDNDIPNEEQDGATT